MILFFSCQFFFYMLSPEVKRTGLNYKQKNNHIIRFKTVVNKKERKNQKASKITVYLKQPQYFMYHSVKSSIIKIHKIYRKDNKITLKHQQGVKTDQKTHYARFIKKTNCNQNISKKEKKNQSPKTNKKSRKEKHFQYVYFLSSATEG